MEPRSQKYSRRVVQAIPVSFAAFFIIGLVMCAGAGTLTSEDGVSDIFAWVLVFWGLFLTGGVTLLAVYAVRFYSRNVVRAVSLFVVFLAGAELAILSKDFLRGDLPFAGEPWFAELAKHLPFLTAGIAYVGLSSLLVRVSLPPTGRWPSGSSSETKKDVRRSAQVMGCFFFTSVMIFFDPTDEHPETIEALIRFTRIDVLLGSAQTEKFLEFARSQALFGIWAAILIGIPTGYLYFKLLNLLFLKIIQWINPMPEEDEAGSENSGEGAAATVPQTG